MTQEHPIIPPLELLKHWEDQHFDEGENYDLMLIQAYQAGADEQLEQDAKWLDTCALFSAHLTITPSGNALREAMRPKQTSLKEQALALLDKAEDPSWDINDFSIVRKALEQLHD